MVKQGEKGRVGGVIEVLPMLTFIIYKTIPFRESREFVFNIASELCT